MLLASGCGSDQVEPLTCEPGPVVHTTIAECELVIDGNGGPEAARLWTIEVEDHDLSGSFELTGDGGVYVFADDRRTAIVARLGPSGEVEWARSLAFADSTPDDAASTAIEASAVGPERLSVAVQRRSWAGREKHYDGVSLIHLSDTGECRDPVSLAFGQQLHGDIGNMVREENHLVLTGTHNASGHARSFVQRRSLAGDLLVEREIDDSYNDDVDFPVVRVGGPEHYVVSYSGYSPNGISSWYSSGQLLDASLTSVGRSGGNYVGDAFGRLYGYSSNATEGDRLTNPPTEPQPPTIYYVTRSSTPDAPAGEKLELEVPQPGCGWPKLALFDETLLVLSCNPPDSPPLLLGYDGAGPPDWTATVSCLGADPDLDIARFDQARRLWVRADSDVDEHILTVEL